MGNSLLDRFGEFIICDVRDETISDWKMILDGSMKGEDAVAVRQKLVGFSQEQLDTLQELVVEIVDTAIHNLLWAIEQDDEIDFAISLEDGDETSCLSEESDGLAGELYSERGWIARFGDV